MTTRTRAELAVAVLQELGVLDASETPTAEDSELVIDRHDELLAHLVDEELAYWAEDEIPLAVFGALRNLVINQVRGVFGEPVTAEEVEARHKMLMGPLRRHVARAPSGTRTSAEYF